MSFGISGISTSSSVSYASAASVASTTLPQPPARNPFADPNGPFANLNLSADQQTQIQQIFSQNQSGPPLSPSQLFDQVENVLSPAQQQTLRSDLETLRSQHHHRHHDADAGGVLAQLNLTQDQQTQIAGILQTAQQSGSAPSDVLSQIENVLTPAQQQQLVSLFSSSSSPASSGSQQTPPVPFNTSA